MRILTTSVLPLLLLAITISSCNSPRHVYAPSLPATPFFTEKGETKIAGYYTGKGDGEFVQKSEQKVNGYEVQGAYAFASRWAFMIGHGYRNELDIFRDNEGYSDRYFKSSDVRYKRRMTDIGFGYFMPIDSRKTIYFGVNSGAGFGNLRMNESGLDSGSANYTRSYGSRLTKLYLQPYFTAHAGENFKISLMTRVSTVHFKETKSDFSAEESEFMELDRIRDRWFTLFEPTVIAQFQIPRAPWLQLEGGIQFSSNPFFHILQSRQVTPFLGVSFDFSKIKK